MFQYALLMRRDIIDALLSNALGFQKLQCKNVFQTDLLHFCSLLGFGVCFSCGGRMKGFRGTPSNYPSSPRVHSLKFGREEALV